MSFNQWAASTGLKNMMKSMDEEGKIDDLSKILDDFIKKNFPSDPASVKFYFVRYILFPLGKSLLKEDPRAYNLSQQVFQPQPKGD